MCVAGAGAAEEERARALLRENQKINYKRRAFDNYCKRVRPKFRCGCGCCCRGSDRECGWCDSGCECACFDRYCCWDGNEYCSWTGSGAEPAVTVGAGAVLHHGQVAMRTVLPERVVLPKSG